jgi:hypothetical protein
MTLSPYVKRLPTTSVADSILHRLGYELLTGISIGGEYTNVGLAGGFVTERDLWANPQGYWSGNLLTLRVCLVASKPSENAALAKGIALHHAPSIVVLSIQMLLRFYMESPHYNQVPPWRSLGSLKLLQSNS